jgi:hypothetical protein
MGTTLLEVANRALGRLGAVRITALTDTTASAKAVAACFPGVPDWVLRSWRWRFALRREALFSPEPVPGGAYAWRYALPADYLGWAACEEDTEALVLEGLGVLSDREAPLWLRYVAQVTDPGQWDPAFAEVLSWKLAVEMQPELAPAVSPFTLSSDFASALKQAHRSGAIEPPCPPPQGLNWEGARR